MKLLYLHGLDSPLTEVKRDILEKENTVMAPSIDYRDKNYMNSLIKSALVADAIIGSSMGGYTGALLSLFHDKPCLLFNPAFVHRSYSPDISLLTIPQTKSSYTKIVLGKLDDVVIYEDNLKYINDNFKDINLKIKTIDNLAHRIPEITFAKEINEFMKEINQKISGKTV